MQAFDTSKFITNAWFKEELRVICAIVKKSDGP